MRIFNALALAPLAVCAANANTLPKIPDWSSDRFLVGTWSCEVSRPGHSPGHERATYSFSVGDRWLKLTYTLSSGDSDTPSVTTEAYESFDARLKKWVYISIGSDGNYGTSYSDGWEGAVKTYGPAASSKERWRFVVTKLSDNAVNEYSEGSTSAGKWIRAESLHCTRSK